MAEQLTQDRVAPNDYERIGGAPAVRAVVHDFYERILADRQLAPVFDRVDMTSLKRHQVQLISHVLGGPVSYEGRDLREAHANLEIRSGDFAAVVAHLVATMGDAGVPDDVVGRVVQALAGSEQDVVTVPEG